jgi:hypothetical protein
MDSQENTFRFVKVSRETLLDFIQKASPSPAISRKKSRRLSKSLPQVTLHVIYLLIQMKTLYDLALVIQML